MHHVRLHATPVHSSALLVAVKACVLHNGYISLYQHSASHFAESLTASPRQTAWSPRQFECHLYTGCTTRVCVCVNVNVNSLLAISIQVCGCPGVTLKARAPLQKIRSPSRNVPGRHDDGGILTVDLKVCP